MTSVGPERPTGRIITFYSYKGGTGRTMALANVAWILASNGYRVLTVDWDLESPGLHRYFHPFLKDKELRSSEGVIDLIRRYAESTIDPRGQRGAIAELAQIEEYAVSLAWDFPSGGVIDFVPAGRQDGAYSVKVSTFNWDSFWQRLGGGAFIGALRRDMSTLYDFVLIDSRTGSSDTAGICTVELPDTVVNCFTLNLQSINGAAAITESILQQRDGEPIAIYPLATRIEGGEKEKLDRGRVLARRRFGRFMAVLGEEDVDAYWDNAEIPYVPYYAYEEMLAAFGDRPRQGASLLARYQWLAGRLAGRECHPPVIAESDRLRVRAEFEQSVPAEPLNVLVVYAPLDRIWAEWIRQRLVAAEQYVELLGVGEPIPDLDRFTRLVTVVSRDYLSARQGGQWWRLGAERVAAGESRFLVAVRVDSAPLTPQPAPRSVLSIMDLPERRTLRLLLSALGLENTTTGEEEPVEDDRRGIRYPLQPAPYFNLQLERNPRFSGRGRILERIRDELLRAGPTGAGRLALTGLPGVGKTQLALEYAYRSAPAYEVVWWISMERPDRARMSLVGLGEKLGLVTTTGTSIDIQVSTVLDALRTGTPVRRWLIILDNADDPEAIASLLPTGPGHVLVTSRNPQWARRMVHLEVDVFRREESVELLHRRVPGLPTGDGELLADRLGNLPLAVEQAGGWISTTGMAVTDYLAVLDHSTAKAMDEDVPPGYQRTITATVRVALDGLRAQNLAAARLLELFSFLAPVLIPYRLINNKRLVAFLTEFDPRMHDPLLHGTLLSEIGRFALARVDSANGGLVVHRLTQEILRSDLDDDEERQRRAEIQAILAAADRGDPDDPATWPVYELLRPHLKLAGVIDSEAPEVRQLVIDMTRYLVQRGDYPSSLQLAHSALDVWLPRFGADDPASLMLKFQLGNALRAMGRAKDSYDLNRDSLARLESTLGADHPYTLMTAYSLAADLRQRGEYHEALELDQATTPQMRTALGPDHPKALNAANNLGVSLWLVGRFGEAADRFGDVHRRRRKVLGEGHPYTISSRMSYGGALRECGDLRRSRDTLVDAVAGFRKVLGAGHPWTLRAAMDYVVTLRRLGEVEEAIELITETYGQYEKVLDPHHPHIISCRLEQACVHWSSGRPDEARRISEDSYELCRRIFGHRHPHTLAAGNDLGVFRRAAGDVDASRQLAEQNSERLQSVLGPLHPYTLVGRLNLANALYADGARSEARQRDEEVYSRLRRVLPDGHPTVLAAAVNHAISHRTEEPERAEELLAEAVRGFQSALGDEHRDTRAAREFIRIDVDVAPLPL
nr:FxSxx-COOH system tetratricopeptide repeat protein [Micromonospora sp. DSM 115978]